MGALDPKLFCLITVSRDFSRVIRLLTRYICCETGICVRISGQPVPGLSESHRLLGTALHRYPRCANGPRGDEVPQQAQDTDPTGRAWHLLHPLARHHRQPLLLQGPVFSHFLTVAVVFKYSTHLLLMLSNINIQIPTSHFDLVISTNSNTNLAV